jgi:hypothetical protein
VVAQLLHRVDAVERRRPLLEGLLEPGREGRHPVAARLDGGHPQRREPAEHAVADQRGDRIEDRAVAGDELPERIEPEGLELRAPPPRLGQEAVARLAGVEGDDRSGLGQLAPHAVVRGVPQAARAERIGDRTGADHDDASAVLEHAGRLRLRRGRVEQAEVGRGEDAVLVGVAPVVLHPPVERAEGGLGGLGIVGEGLLHPDAQRGEEEAGLHALVVHALEAGVAVAVLGADGLELAEGRADVVAGRLAPEVVVEHAGPGHGIERRVRDEAVDLARDHQPRLSVDRGPLDGPTSVLGLQVARERVGRLVVVVVGIEQLEAECGHGSPSSGARTRSSVSPAERG